MRSDYEGRRSKCTWLNCILCIPLILSESPNECWLRTCDACVITSWRLGLRAPLVACKTYTGSGLGPEGGVIAVVDLGEGRAPRAPPLIIFWRPDLLLISGCGLPAPHFSEGLDPPLDRYHICLSFLKWSSLKSTRVICKKVTNFSSQNKHLWYVNVYRLNNQVFSSLFQPLISSKF